MSLHHDAAAKFLLVRINIYKFNTFLWREQGRGLSVAAFPEGLLKGWPIEGCEAISDMHEE